MKLIAGAAALSMVMAFAGGASQAALLKSYDFNSGLGDTLGNGASLAASGGAVSGGRYSFDLNQGLRLTSALPSTTDFAVEIRFQVNDSTGGYNKLIDFQDLGSDIGLYVLNGAIDFYTVGPTGGSVSLDTDTTIGLARAGGSISVFQDGSLLFNIADSGQAVPAGNVLNFFEDDTATGQSEAFAGSVDFIRIHDDASTFGQEPAAVPVPGALAFGLAGMALLGLKARRR